MSRKSVNFTPMRLSGLLLLLPTTTLAQSDIVGKDRFPEFRNFGGFSGTVIGVDENGHAGIRGAVGISTPIAHSLGRNQWVLGIGNTSFRGGLRFFQDKNALADGTAWGQVGFSTPYGNISLGGMVLSTKLDNVMNLQFTPKTEWDNLAVAIGVQDVFSSGGSSGEAIDLPSGGGNSRSLYAVATVKLLEGAYLSVGTGTRRFEGIFGNISANVSRSLKAVVEHDRFNWNYGLSAEIGSMQLENRTFTWSAFVGQIRGRYWTWSVGVRF
ncbi:MAG TPA: hypothetical protein PKA27_15310 [Fimbriimonadaceae bacterium]|nr:hypothetical protein [Fimbriimonadaceae bacterium]